PQLLVFGVLVRGGRWKGGAPRLLESVLTRRRGAPPFQRVRRSQPPAQGIGQGMGEGGEGGEDFLGGFDQGGTVADQAMAAAGLGVADGARQGEDLAAGLRGEAGGDQ